MNRLFGTKEKGSISIDDLETSIERLLSECDIWGDIDVDSDGYGVIKEKIMQQMGPYPAMDEVRQMLRKYPLTMVTDIIGFILYEYENNDIWKSWATRYGLELNVANQTEIGKLIKKIFEFRGLDIIEDGGFAYITPIMCQAGIPNVCLDNVFDLLSNIVVSEYFNPKEIVNELMGYRSYLIDAPVQRFFKFHTDRAIDFLSQLRDVMRYGSKDIMALNNSEMPIRIVRQYENYEVESKKTGNRSRKRNLYLSPPKLVYDNLKGVCILLPAHVLQKTEYSVLLWTIFCDNDDMDKFECEAKIYTNKEGYETTKEILLPVKIASHYEVTLKNFDDGIQIYSPWNILGINDFFAFNTNGSMLSHNQMSLSRKGTLFLFERKNTSIIGDYGISIVEELLPDSLGSYEAYWVYPEEQGAWIELEGDDISRIEFNNPIDFELMQRGTLFDEIYAGTEIPVFTKFPAIEIKGGTNELQNGKSWSVIANHKRTNTKHIFNLDDFIIRDTNGTQSFSLNECLSSYYGGLYGEYEIRIRSEKNRKFLNFYLAPEIEYLSRLEGVDSDNSLDERQAFFYIKKYSNISFTFTEGTDVNILLKKYRGSSWEEISTLAKPAYIYGRIKILDAGDEIEIPFKKTIRKYDWSFWNEDAIDGESVGTKKCFYIDELQNRWRLKIHFTPYFVHFNFVSLLLESANSKQLQKISVYPDKYGNSFVNMGIFYDTIKDSVLPLRIRLNIDNSISVSLATIEKYVQLKNIKYAEIENKPLICWDMTDDFFDENNILKVIPLPGVNAEARTIPLKGNVHYIRGKKDETKVYEGVYLEDVLPAGVYYVNADIAGELDDFFKSNEENSQYGVDNLLTVKRKELYEKLHLNGADTLAEWLVGTISLFNARKQLQVLISDFEAAAKKNSMYINWEIIPDILFTLVNMTTEKYDLAEEVRCEYERLLNAVSLICFNNHDRSTLLIKLIKMDMPANDCKPIIDKLQLYLCDVNDFREVTKSMSRKLWNIDSRLAMLLLTRCDNGSMKDELDIERMLAMVGSDVLEKIISFDDCAGSCSGNDTVDCIKNVFSNKCRCANSKLNNTSMIWGDATEYAKLMSFDKHHNLLVEKPYDRHTQCYRIFGKNFLNIMYDYEVDEKKDNTLDMYIKAKKREISNIVYKYEDIFPEFFDVIKKRQLSYDDTPMYYYIAGFSMLTALMNRGYIDNAYEVETKDFWSKAMKSVPELAYRDLIMSEIYLLFNGGGKAVCQ